MTVLSSMTSLGAAVRRTVRDPTRDDPAERFAAALPTLALLRAYADNTLYDDVALWQSYKSRYRLPRTIRSVYNPAPRVVAFYASHVFRGDWTEDGKPTPDGDPNFLRIPADVLAEREPFVVAMLQGLSWGNWQSAHKYYVSEGSTVGSVFVEIIDDLERTKVYPVVHPIERLADLSLDASGNVRAYDIRYLAVDDPWEQWQPATAEIAGRRAAFRYRKVVTPDWIVEWRDERVVREDPNPYGFTPGVFVKHRDRGGLLGAPPIEGVIPKIDEANRLATGIHNYVARLQAQPQIIASASQPAPLASQTKAGETLSDDDLARFEELIPWLWTNDVNSKSFPLMQAMPVEGASAALANLIAEIESDLPETTVDRELRAMSQVTGPGAQRLVSDATGRLEEAQANYIRGTIATGQMLVSIGGWRANGGGWPRGTALTREMAKFLPFGLDSFKRGDEDLMCGRAPLFDETDQERFQALAIKKDLAGLPDAAVQAELGYDEAARAQFAAEAAASFARNQAAFGLTPFGGDQPQQQPQREGA